MFAQAARKLAAAIAARNKIQVVAVRRLERGTQRIRTGHRNRRRRQAAARIEPALAAGRWVVCDRFSDATFAYQVGGRGLARAKFDALEAWVHPGLQPDLTLLFDLPPEIAAARVASTGADPDRFEREQRDFFMRVREAYLERARMAPQRIRVLDANRAPELIRADIERMVAALVGA